jgi:ribosomal protein L19
MEQIRTFLLKGIKLPRAKVGDVLDLTYEDNSSRWGIRKFTGICIAITSRKGLHRCTLRNVFNDVSVELSFDLVSPVVISLLRSPVFKLVNKKRAKLYYLRRSRISDSTV